MKFRTFRNVIAMVLFLGLGGTCYGCYAWWHKSLAEEEMVRRVTEEEARKASMILEAKRAREAAEQARLAAANPVSSSPAVVSSPGEHWQQAAGLRPVDTDALTALARPVVDKIKDAAKGKPWKINVYADDATRFNRLKIDLDRDEKEDETWTIFADGHIERKVSSKDNGTFDGTFRLEMTGWQDMAAAPATPTTPVTPTTTTTPSLAATTATTADGLRPVDRDMLALVASVAVQEKVKDATKGKTWKINLYADDGARFNRAKIDLDRDDKWDESWTWKSDGIERQVAPADDEKYSEVYRLKGESWTRK